MQNFELYPLGDAAVVIRFGQQIASDVHARIRALATSLEASPFDGLIEYVPAYTTVTVYYDPWVVSGHGRYNAYAKVAEVLQSLCEQLVAADTLAEANIVEIPVCYGGEYGPDMMHVAAYHQHTPEEVVAIHTGAIYTVYMLGFAPGFPYLGGMQERIATPRKENPRQRIPAGSVGIAGGQTGIYPMETPGGWQLIGRTYVSLFNPDREQPSLLRAGDRVKFVAVSEEAYQSGKEGACES